MDVCIHEFGWSKPAINSIFYGEIHPMPFDNLNPARVIGRIVLSGAIAIATTGIASVTMAQQNLSDVTGPNLSDVTGPNLSDNTGTNPSDNPDPTPPTAVLPESIDGLPVDEPIPTPPTDSGTTPPTDSGTTPTTNPDPTSTNNTPVPSDPIFTDVDGNAATLGQSLDSFFGRFGEDLGIASTTELRAKVAQAQAACATQPNDGTRRFALNPRTPQFNQACEEFNQLIQSIREDLNQWRRDNMPTNAVQRRLW